jgi:hypothetical protein
MAEYAKPAVAEWQVLARVEFEGLTWQRECERAIRA